MTLSAKCFPLVSICLIGALAVYGIAGIIINVQELGSNNHQGPWPFNPSVAHVTFSILQSFFFVSAIFGVLALWKRERVFYFSAAAVYLTTFIVLMIFGAVCLRTSQKDMSTALYNYMNKLNNNSKEFDWFYQLQYEHKCCGVKSFHDWTFLKTGLPNASVPATCCIRTEQTHNPGPKCSAGVLSPGNNLSSITKIIYVRACGPILSPKFQYNTLVIGMEMIIVAFFSIFAATYLFCGASELFCMKQKQLPRPSDFDSSQITTQGVRFPSFDNDGDDDDKSNLLDRNSKTRATIDSRGNLHKDGGNSRSSRAAAEAASKWNLGRRSTSSKRSKSRGKSDGAKKKTAIKNHKQQLLHKINSKNSIETRKTQLNKNGRGRNGNKWRGTSRIDSKALMVGNRKVESRSSFIKDDLFRKKLEMLYEGVDKNISTLSTTPNPSGSVFFPWSSMNRSSAGHSGNSNKPPAHTKEREHHNPNPPEPFNRTINNKSMFPSLSHYSSVPQFHLVKPTNADFGLGITAVQYNPHFAMNQNQLHSHRHIYSYAHALANIGLDSSGGRCNAAVSPITTPVNNKPVMISFTTSNNANATDLISGPVAHAALENVNLFSPPDIDMNSTLSPEILLPTLEIETSDPAVYPSPASTTMSTTIRSSTLATIQEESESIKSSPKGLTPDTQSPAGEERSTPLQLTDMFGQFRGSFINDLSNIDNPTIPTFSINEDNDSSAIGGADATGSSSNKLHQDNFENEVIIPLSAVGTEEFIPNELSDIDNNGNGNRSHIEDTLSVQAVIDAFKELEGEFMMIEADELREAQKADVEALAKAHASKAQFRLGFN